MKNLSYVQLIYWTLPNWNHNNKKKMMRIFEDFRNLYDNQQNSKSGKWGESTTIIKEVERNNKNWFW